MLIFKKNVISFNIEEISQQLLVSILIIYCVLFPADLINIKEVLLVLSFIFTAPALLIYLLGNNFKIILFYGIFFPILIAILSIINSVPLYDILSYSYVWIFILLVPAITHYNIDINKPIIFATMLIATFTLAIAILDLLNFIPFYENPLRLFFTKMNELQSGKGIYSTFGYSIFFKASPLIYFTLSYMVKNKKNIYVILLTLALFASGSRANAIIAIFVITGTIFIELKSYIKNKLVVFIFIIIFIMLLILFSVHLHKVFLLKSASDAIRTGDFFSIIEFMSEDPLRYLFGSGVGSYFYSVPRGKLVNIVEISFMDYFRQIGLIGFIPFIIFIIYPFFYMPEQNKWLLIPYLGYLATAFTNPLLVSSTSFVAYIIVYNSIYNIRNTLKDF